MTNSFACTKQLQAHNAAFRNILLAAVMAVECSSFVILVLRVAIVINFTVSSHLSGNIFSVYEQKKKKDTALKLNSLV